MKLEVVGKIKKAGNIIGEKGLFYFFSKLAEKLFFLLKPSIFYIISPLVLMKVKKASFRSNEETLEFVFNGFWGIIAPLQIKEEISQFVSLIGKREKPRVVLEIGTARGGVLFLLAKSAHENAVVISVDLPSSDNKYPGWRTRLYSAFASGRQKIHLLKADSHQSSTVEEVKKILNNRQIDVLFIDGDHTYGGVKKDFEMYGPLVGSGGIIAFHDIAVHPPEANCGVDKLWNEIKNNFKYLEIINDKNQDWGGIGIIYK